jgi:hypothetical protein
MDSLTLSSPPLSSTTPETTHQRTTTSSSNPNHNPTTTTIAEVKAQKGLWYKLHVFIFDLRDFREAPDSQARLDSIVDASYIGLPYFTPKEVGLLKSTRIPISALSGNNNWNPKPVTSKAEEEEEEYKTLDVIIEETLNERLERKLKKR